MIPLRRVLQLTLATATVLSLTALAPPPAGTRITDSAILSEQVAWNEVDSFVARHQGLGAEALDRDPAVVAAWWRALPERDRLRMPGQMPDVIGNLAGVDYASRDRSNRLQLAAQLAAMEELATYHALGGIMAQRYAALQAIERALNFQSVPRYLVELTDDQLPLAAISIGDLDTASMVTFAVPGMGTFTTDMQLWTRAAKNIYDAQAAAGASRQAVVAWIGYRTPPVGVEATRDSYADRGAELLERDIRGLRESRSGGYQPTINIVAHSYGATTAAKTLRVDLGIRSFVMLGPAGVDTSVRSAGDLAAQFVFTGEARLDLQARWGRVDRTDPAGTQFGALAIPVDGDTGAGLLAVTGHVPIIHSPWNDDPESPAWTKYEDADVRTRLYENHMVSFGYLDVGTQSLAEVGLVTTPPQVRAYGEGEAARRSSASSVAGSLGAGVAESLRDPL